MNTPQMTYGKGSIDGRLVHVDDVPNGLDCNAMCLACDAALIARQGRVRQHHFAHAVESDCTGEGWIHYGAKMALAERIVAAVESGDAVPMRYSCRVSPCQCTHRGNIAKGAERVIVEKRIDGIQPDIRIEGQHPKVIEIVDSHEPEMRVHDFASENDLPLLVVSVKDESDITMLKSSDVWVEVSHFDKCPCKQEAHTKRLEQTECDVRWCKQCGKVVEDMRGQFGGYGDHKHCAVCGELLEGRNEYNRHFCCYIADRFGLPLCPDKDQRTHGHCKKCGQRTGEKKTPYGEALGEFYDMCYPCNKRATVIKVPPPEVEEKYDALNELMTDYLGKPPKQPRTWVVSEDELLW